MRQLCVLSRRTCAAFAVATVIFRRFVIALMVFNGFQKFVAFSRWRTPLLFLTGFIVDNLHHALQYTAYGQAAITGTGFAALDM